MQELATIQETLNAVKKSNTVMVLKNKDNSTKTVAIVVTTYDEQEHCIKPYNIPYSLINDDNRIKYYLNKAKLLQSVLSVEQKVGRHNQWITPMEFNSKNFATMVKTKKEATNLLEPFIISGYGCP